MDGREDLPKVLNFKWLLETWMKGKLPNTLARMTREQVAELYSEIEFQSTQMSERFHQGSIGERKFNKIKDDLNTIKGIFQPYLVRE